VSEGKSDRPEAQKRTRPARAAYKHFLSVPTRWMDNDAYGHVNNVVYYSYFDTIVNQYLVEQGGLDIAAGDVIGVVAETMCRFFASLSFPEVLDVGMRVARLGTSSVTYEIAVFARGDDLAAAAGHFVHVYVDRASRKPVGVPQTIRDALLPLA
jgi:acyl-CoA thioester hydrolase